MPPLHPSLAFFGKAGLWLAIVWLFASRLSTQPIWWAIAGSLLIACPITAVGLYGRVVRKTIDLTVFKKSGWIFRLWSGNLLGLLIWVVLGISLAWLTLLRLSLASWEEWVFLSAATLVYWIAYRICCRKLVRELNREYLVSCFAVRPSGICTMLLAGIAYGFIIWQFGYEETYATMKEALSAKREQMPDMHGSPLLEQALMLMTASDAATTYFAGWISNGNPVALKGLNFLTAIAPLPAVVLGVSAFSVRWREYGRLLSLPSQDDVPPPISSMRVGVSSALLVLVVGFIYVPAVANLDDKVRRNPEIKGALQSGETKLVELIDGKHVRPGTKDALDATVQRSILELGRERAALESKINEIFLQMKHNTDSYLDWYYSLAGEYARLGAMLTGKIEKLMTAKLQEHLDKGSLSQNLKQYVHQTMNVQQGLPGKLRPELEAIIESRRVDVTDGKFKVVAAYSLKDFKFPSPIVDRIPVEARLGGGAGATGVATLIAYKTSQKAIFKLAAKTIAKMAAKRAAGVAIGAGIGAVLGSVVPAAGTAAVGAIGGVVGGLAMDKALISLEEAINRENFKKEIVEEIEKYRTEFIQRLGLSDRAH
jgi:hypothetical protein